MERAIWLGNEYIASNIVKDFSLERSMRKASCKALFCPDPNCSNPLLRYCHGEKKQPYFAHKTNANCDYAKYDKRLGYKREILQKLYNALANKGYNIQIDYKLLPNHYTHLVLNSGSQQLALELADKHTRTSQIVSLENDYKTTGIDWKWIVIDEINELNYEYQFNNIKRSALNNSKFNDVIVLDRESGKVAQYRLDVTKYIYNSQPIDIGYSEVYMQLGTIESLIFINGDLMLSSFQENYQNWLNEKSLRFNDEIEKRKQYQSNLMDKSGFSFSSPQNKQVNNIPNRNIDYRNLYEIIKIFSKFSYSHQVGILNYIKKQLTPLELLIFNITSDTPLLSQFRIIYSNIPDTIQEKIFNRYFS